MASDNCELYKFTKYFCNAGQFQEFILCFGGNFALSLQKIKSFL